MPQILMQLIRREEIPTTLKYDVGQDTELTANTLYEAVKGATSGDIGNSVASVAATKKAENPDAKGLSANTPYGS